VHVVSLTGHGARRSESGPHITLGDHVADVVAMFDEHDLVEATLVGHSYGGRVITRAWPQVATRVRRMIYLDAHAPLGPADAAGAEPYEVDDDGLIAFTEFVPSEGVVDAAFFERLVPQSARTLAEPFRVELPASLDKTFVHASAEPSGQFQSYAEAARRDPAWRYLEVQATHWLMYTHPHEVTAIILDPDHA